MVHPTTDNPCPNIGKTATVKVKGHHLNEAKAGAKKVCSNKFCRASYVLK